MSFLNSRKNLLCVAGLLSGGGSLAGCATEDESLVESSSQHYASTSGWNLKGNIFGTGAADEATDVMVGTDGVVYVSGYENGALGQSSVDPGGDAKGVIYAYHGQTMVKLSTSHTFDSRSSAEVIEALAMDPFASGSSFDIYYTGRSNGSFAGPNAGQFDTIAGWVTPSGTVQKFQYGNARPQHPRRLSVNASRDLVIAGYDDIYVPVNFVEAWEDPFVLKLRRSGNSLIAPMTGWPIQFGSSNSDVLQGLGVAQEEGSPVYVTGTTTSGAGRGMFVKKYGADGTLSWHSQQSPSGLDSAAAVAVLANDNVIFAGATYTRQGDQSFGEQDLVLRALSPDNQVLWTKQIGTASSELITDIALDMVGNIYVVGETLGTFDPAVPNQGDVDIFLLKLSWDGNVMSTFQLGSPGDDHPAALALGFDGGVYVSGYTDARLFSDKNPKGGRDGFVFRVTPPPPPIGTLR